MKNYPFNSWKVLTAATLLFILSQFAIADVYVIANTGGISDADLRDIFLGEKQFSGALKLIPIDNSAAQEEFLSKVIKVDVTKYNATWTKKSFRDGATPPAVKSNDLEVISYVKSTPGAVAYVNSEPKGVVLIKKF